MPASPALYDLITPEYLTEQERLHADPRGYGGRGDKWAPVVADLIVRHGFASVVDYGCGQGKLGEWVIASLPQSEGPVYWRNYDPARTEWNRLPKAGSPFDLVVCTDVLEHVEPEKIGAVLSYLRELTREGGLCFTVISLVPTEKKLSDGRQAHILLQSPKAWAAAIEAAGFEFVSDRFPNPKPEKQWVCTWRPI